MANDPVYVKGPRGNLIQVLVRSAKTFESLFSDSYLSDAGPGIGQQLVWPHRFYCDGGGILGGSELGSRRTFSFFIILGPVPPSGRRT